MMTARWGYEALAVEQFMHNKYDEPFYPVNKAMSIAEYKKNYWIKNLENKIDFIERDIQSPGNQEKTSDIPDTYSGMKLFKNYRISKKFPFIMSKILIFRILTS